MAEFIDQPTSIRSGEELALSKLENYLANNLSDFGEISTILQFPGGYSNLTYLITSGDNEYVLRKPPLGANIKSAHDMEREFRVLTGLLPHYGKIPSPVLLCDSEEVIGSKFYVMKRVKGVILREEIPPGIDLSPSKMQLISQIVIDNLVDIHSIDVVKTGLLDLGRPEGYVTRQVEGWTRRYLNSETDRIETMNACSDWLQSNMPAENPPALIHNDYKFDNLVLDPVDQSTILAVLDWEMATVGDPLMDLGTAMSYWAENDDDMELKSKSLTRLEGSLSREEMVERYFQRSGRRSQKVLFYYVYGCFKLGVIIQQIYFRFKQGVTQDQRFAGLLGRVKACGESGAKAIKFDRISHFY